MYLPYTQSVGCEMIIGLGKKKEKKFLLHKCDFYPIFIVKCW